jgi:hypothetical protein
MAIKIEAGDVFSIKTSIGFGFLQYVETDILKIEYVRVLTSINKEEVIIQKEVDLKERWCISFPLKEAIRKNKVSKIGSYKIPIDYITFDYARSQHIVRGEHLGWHIVNRKSLKRELKNTLEKEDLKLSPHGVFNDVLIIEYLEKDWKIEDWR